MHLYRTRSRRILASYIRLCIHTGKVGCGHRMVVVAVVRHAEFGPNDHREDAPHFLFERFHFYQYPSLKPESFYVHRFYIEITLIFRLEMTGGKQSSVRARYVHDKQIRGINIDKFYAE